MIPEMRKLLVVLIVAVFFTGISSLKAQIIKNVKKLVQENSTGITEKDATDGIREALTNGTGSAVKLVSNLDGYFKNPEIKIPFPKDAKIVETKLRAIGLGNKVDEVVLTINRAAEQAAKEAIPIFVSAIKSMSIKDAINIVKGDNDAATKYLQKSSTPELTSKFQPIIKKALDQVYATKYWSDVIKTYNKIPMVKKMNPNLNEYVTGKAIEGLFIMVAKEELKIRKDPVARTSEILKKVFGS
jgi:hypothetical protein